MDTKPADIDFGRSSARALAGAVIRKALIVWGAVSLLALGSLYLLDASPFHAVEITFRWWRAGDAPAPSHQATGAIKVQP